MNTLPLFAHDGNPPLKKCSKCPNSYPATAEFFYRKSGMKDGLQSMCKTCDAARRKAHYEAHREESSEYHKQYYEANKEKWSQYRNAYNQEHKDEVSDYHKRYRQENKEKISEYQAQYRQENREQRLESGREYYHENIEKIREYRQENKERILERTKQYRQENKEQISERKRQYLQTEKGRIANRSYSHRRRVLNRNAEGSYTPDQIQDQLKRQKHKCYWCQKRFEKDNKKHVYHIDHIVPLARGGSNDISNVVCACPDCNLRKSDKLPHEWVDGGRLL